MSMSYIILIVIVLKISRISNAKNKRIKFPNLWLFPILFILMIIQDYKSTLSFSVKEIPILTVFALIGLGVGIIRGRTLKYHIDNASREVYYNESYLSLGVYILLILMKWMLKYMVGNSAYFISIGLIVFGCASMIGRSIWLSYNYLKFSNGIK